MIKPPNHWVGLIADWNDQEKSRWIWPYISIEIWPKEVSSPNHRQNEWKTK